MEVTGQAAQAVRGLQAAFDEAAAAQTAGAIRQLHQALGELGSWIRENGDVLPVILALIQAGAAGQNRETAP